MKKLLTLVAGYAAGLAVARKYRKDHGKSKLSADPDKSKLDNFLDEVVDIHKSAYGDAKEYVETNLEDVKDMDSLKTKVTTKMSGLASEAETLLSSLKERGLDKKEELLDEAKSKGVSLSDLAVDKLTGWIDEAKQKLDTAHTAVNSKLDTAEASLKPVPKKNIPAKKPVPKKTATK
jgi:hypothetical protein